MKHATGRYLRVRLRNDDGPHLGVQIIAVQIVGQRTVCRSAEHVEETVVRDHCVSVAAGRRWWGDAKNVLVRDATPTRKQKLKHLLREHSKLCERLLTFSI